MKARAAAVLLLLVLTGCGRKVVQTAEQPESVPESDPLDCQTSVGVSLPDDPTFGTGNEPPSIVVGDEYPPFEGPGLYVTARDAFRVFLNGELVRESREARTAEFVPLSLLPGENALSIVVSAKHGTPTALVHLDELETTTVSDASFRVSTAPPAGFADDGFDDGEWPQAHDYGAPDALPGCDPGGAFPKDSDARWIGPEPGSGTVAVLRKVIRIEPLGFGASTTGGAGAEPALVTTFDELEALAASDEPAVIVLPDGDYDFRDAPRVQSTCPSTCSNDATKPIHTVLVGDQTCAVDLVDRERTDRTLQIRSNKTIVGLGRGARIRGITFVLSATENAIVRNVALYGVSPDLVEAGDAFTLDDASRIWLDHCTTKWISDDFISARARNVTFSWMRFDGVTSYECNNAHTRVVQLDDSTATLHHCFFDHVLTHSPRVDGASQVHLYDNLLADNVGYAVAAICGAQVLMEGNTFERVVTPTTREACDDMSAPGRISASGNHYRDDVGLHKGGDGSGDEPHDDGVFDPGYPYTLDDDEDDWLTVLTSSGAGGEWALPLSLD